MTATLRKRLLLLPPVALAISIAGLILLGSKYEDLGRLLFVYPASLLAYVVPTSLLQRVPEAWLFFLGLGSSVVVWTLIFGSLILVFKRTSRAA